VLVTNDNSLSSQKYFSFCHQKNCFLRRLGWRPLCCPSIVWRIFAFSCSYDHLAISQLRSPGGPEQRRQTFCAQSVVDLSSRYLDFDAIGSKTIVKITFSSDYATQLNGFSIFYQASKMNYVFCQMNHKRRFCWFLMQEVWFSRFLNDDLPPCNKACKWCFILSQFRKKSDKCMGN